MNEDLVESELAKLKQDLRGQLAKSAMPTPPEQLFHYTSGKGLLGILESGKVWLTSVKYMNDLSELNYSHQLFLETLEEAKKQFTAPALKVFFHFIDPIVFPYGKESWDVYAFCFCEHGDQLSQWRAYAENCRGFAIGFEGPRLILILLLHNQRDSGS